MDERKDEEKTGDRGNSFPRLFGCGTCALVLALFLSACASTGVQLDGSGASEARDDISELEAETAGSAVQSADLAEGLELLGEEGAGLERVIVEQSGDLDELEAIIREVRRRGPGNAGEAEAGD